MDRYGPDFRYGHHVKVKKLRTVIAGVAAVGGIFALAQVGPARRRLLESHRSGQGPDAARRARSHFSVTFLGEGGGRRVRTRVSGGDPGYDETAKMIAECALALLQDRERLPAFHGVITPAMAFGEVLIDRLTRAGIRFEVC